jgi:hypothetical protein
VCGRVCHGATIHHARRPTAGVSRTPERPRSSAAPAAARRVSTATTKSSAPAIADERFATKRGHTAACRVTIPVVRKEQSPSPGLLSPTLVLLPRSDSAAAHGRPQHRAVADRPLLPSPAPEPRSRCPRAATMARPGADWCFG